jgi:two-component system, OmpR family, sensor histidine kinase SenX3
MLKYWRHLPALGLILAAALVGLLTVLGTLQYRWAGELSKSELELTRAALRAGAERLSEDFDRELASAFLNLRMNRFFLRNKGWENYTEVYDKWLSAAAYPKLISDLYLVRIERNGQVQLARFNRYNRHFEPSAWPASLEDLRQRSERLSQALLFPNQSPEGHSPTLFDGEVPALIIPMSPRLFAETQPEQATRGAPDPALVSYIIASLDLDCIKQEIIPALAQRYFSGGGDNKGLNYDLTIVSRRNPARTIYSSASESIDSRISDADVKVDLFRLRWALLASMSVHRSSSMAPSRSGRPGPREPVRSFPLLPNLTRQFLRQIAETSAEGQWQLAVMPRDGSLQQIVANTRRRNLRIGFLILLLLAASVVMIFILIRRMHLLAKQQMEFVAGVSHDLRTPVAVLCSASENLADGMIATRDEMLQYGEMIRSESYQLAELVEHVLEFAGTQSLRNPYRLSPVPVEEVIESSLTSYAPHFADLGFSVEKDLQEHLPLVMADRSALGRAIQNLLSNALKFSGEQRWIKMRAQTGDGKRGKEVLITVEDHGIGIEPHELKNIFEPFRRGKAVLSSSIHGSGLGLSLVKHIVEGHSGRVSVRSVPGKGSAFTLRLPAMSGPAPE